MNELAKIKDGLQKLNFILTSEQKKYCILVFILSIISALFEMLGVSIIIPLMQAFLSPDSLKNQVYIAPFVRIFHLQTTNQIVIFICIGITVIYIIKNIYSIFYVWVSNKFSNKIKRELSVQVLKTYMQQGYNFFVNNNTARLVRGLDADISSVYAIVLQIFNFCSKALTILGITVFIIAVTPEMAIFLCCLVLFCFLLIQIIFRKSMQKNGNLRREYAYKCNQATYEALQGSKEVLVTNRQDFFVERYTKCLEGVNKTTVKIAVGESSPANIIEAICISGLMIAVAFQMVTVENPSELLTQMATIAVAAFRILPSLGTMLSAVNSIVFHAPALSASYDTLNMIKGLKKEDNGLSAKGSAENAEKQHSFQKELILSHVTFAYDNANVNVIDDLDLRIEKGKSVAFIGSSGAGKTTLADIILALFRPQGGEILMDGINIEELGEEWHRIIGYVPQSVYMIDSTIRRNIAFGIKDAKIDEKKVWKALEMAQLKDFVESLPDGLDTKVGELGVKFSGGQRQRVAIARALYNEPDILVLDEATAALDTETETAVMESIEALQGYKTLIIVAHRLTTIRNCDEIYEIKDGKAIKKCKAEVL